MTMEPVNAEPYQDENDWPRLRPSWVLYLDALGTKEEANNITDDSLRDLALAESWYRRFLHHENLEQVQRSLYFTDDIVVARPDDSGDAASLAGFFDLLLGVSVYVVGMAVDLGRAVRGGFSRGPACIDTRPLARDGAALFSVAHGEGLISAVVLEQQRAKVPRIVLGDRARAHIESCLLAEGDPAPLIQPRPRVVRDKKDGEVFVDHLGWVMQDTEPNLNLRDGNGEPMQRAEIMGRYRQFVMSGLDHPAAADKYRWLAGYHDYIVGLAELGVPTGVGDPTQFEVW